MKQARYYKVTTLNSTYYLRHCDLRPTNYNEPTKTEIEVWGQGQRYFTLSESRKPLVGEVLYGRDATGTIKTTVIKSIETIGFKQFFRGHG